MNTGVGLPNVNQPVVGPKLLIETVWFRFLQLLWMRTGSSQGTLQLAQFIVDMLPANQPEGATAFVTDATATTFLSTVVGGGTNHVPVVFLSGLWKIG